MERLKKIFDYQRFEKNKKLQSQIDDVYNRYFTSGTELSDEELDVSAAGTPFYFLSEQTERHEK